MMKLFSAKPFDVKLLVIYLFLSGISAVSAASGDVDPTFNAAAFGINNGTILVIEKQPDGKILIGGTFTEVNGHQTTAVARLNANGTVDTSFSSPDFGNGGGVGGAVYALGVQSDGKVVVGGDIYGVNGIFNKKLYRLNPNGTLDNTFQSPVLDLPNSWGIIYDLEILPDDRIVFGGDFTISNGAIKNIARLNADGTLGSPIDNTTSAIIYAIEILPDGKILSAGKYLKRNNADGSNDSSFTSISLPGGNETVFTSALLLPDGKMIVGGRFESINGFTVQNLARINANGSLDLSFNQNNAGPNDVVNDLLLAPDGKIIIAGFFSHYNTVARQKVARLNANGTLDTSFVNNPELNSFYGKTVEFLTPGKILLGGGVQSLISPLYQLNDDGSVDTFVTYTISRTGAVQKIVIQPDGKILIAGTFVAVNGVKRNSLARLNADGSLDASFVPYFNDELPQNFNSLAIQPDGKILVGGPLRRLNPDGSQDMTFTAGLGIFQLSMFDIVVLPNGQILAGGQLSAPNNAERKIVRLNSDGSFDSSFAAAQPNQPVFDIELQPDGNILIGGNFQQIGATLRGRIARLNGADGSLDAAFNPPGGANGPVRAIDLQADGKIVVVGEFTGLNGSSNQQRIGRLNADGTLDESFEQSADAAVLSVKIQPDGKILIGGGFSAISNVSRIGFARLNSNGTLDTAFSANAPNRVLAIELQTDGKILIGGDFVKVKGIPRLRIARLLNTPGQRAPYDFDGDGRTDIGVWRASSGSWWYLHSSDLSGHGHSFGLPDDIITPGDFTGDGKTDVAIWRPSTGEWFVRRSEDGSYFSYQFGLTGDIPAPADYDGDGITDTATFRPSTQTWYIFLSSTGTFGIVTFGLDGDRPVPADYDGDGKADIAVWRPSNGSWWIVRSSDLQQRGYGFGTGTDKPVVGDYTGDGKADIAVWRDATREWFFLRSEDGSYYSYPSGLPGDIPAPGDYDGDGRFDSAVFRPSTQTWYIDGSTAGSMIATFGLNGDRPVPNAFVP